MSEKYFQKFNQIFYNETKCLDLSRRVKITEASRKNVNLFYPVVLKSGFRADSLADAYYGDAEVDWLIYLTNEIVDPYYEWYLPELEFNDFILAKYGSVEAAQETILYYVNNWATDHTEISPSFYENTLAFDEKQYYNPSFAENAKVLSYYRKRIDYSVNTNKILQYDITYTSGNSFSNGEIIDIKTGGEVVGNGTAIVCNSTVLIVQHVSGNLVANSTWSKTLIGETSNTEATTLAVTTLHEIISNAEARFWTSLTAYDWEVEENERRKHLQVMAANRVRDAAEQVRLQMLEV